MGGGGGVGGERLCSNNKVDINMQNCQCVCLFIMCWMFQYLSEKQLPLFVVIDSVCGWYSSIHHGWFTFGWSPYINLMLYSISALHTSFYNLHQFVYLDSHAHAKCLLHIGLLMNIPVAQGHISDGPSRYKLQGHQLRFSIRLKTHTF